MQGEVVKTRWKKITELEKIENAIIKENYKITRGEALELYEAEDVGRLAKSADRIRQSCAPKNISICSIINAKSGGCSENCKYCAQSAHWKTSCAKTDFVAPKNAVEFCDLALKNKVRRVALVASGRGTTGKDFDAAIECFSKMKSKFGEKLQLCASLGIISFDALLKLKEIGVVRYHHNLETSENFYPNICTTHTYRDRVQTILDAKKAGLEICSGGIIGLGESAEDRIDIAFALRDLDVQSVPINILTAIKGTPLENNAPLLKEEILKTIAIFRFIMPSQMIRCAAGRKNLGAFQSGANALISGDFLTPQGSANNEDIAMLE